MKFVVGCAVLALCVVSLTESQPFGKYVQINVNKSYDGPNFADVLSRLVRQKMDFKNNLWNALMNAKSQSYNYNYSYNQPAYTKTVSINYGPSKTNDNEKEVTTQPPIPRKVAPLVEHEKTFEFKAQSTFSSSSGSSGSSSAVGGRSSTGSDSDSDLVDIADHQKDSN